MAGPSRPLSTNSSVRRTHICMEPNLRSVVEDNSAERFGESISMDKIIFVERSGLTTFEAVEYLSNKKMDTERMSYWYPDHNNFPVIDAIAWLPNESTVLYIQLTVGAEHDLNSTTLTRIHGVVKKALGKVVDVTSWKFKYVAIERNLEDATALSLKVNGSTKKVPDEIGDTILLKGYVTYTMESVTTPVSWE